MKTKLRLFLTLAVMTMVNIQAWGAAESNDTVYFYDTWQQMLDITPAAKCVDPYMYPMGYQMEIMTDDRNFTRNINNRYIAATIISKNDSIWLINSEYLKKNFGGETRQLHDYIPLFFNDKVAYALGSHYGFKAWIDEETADYYYIDFINRKVTRITAKTLSQLLEDYHDLQMRYEGMKDYKKPEIIEDYFFKYIDRATQDFMKPYIVDLMD